MSVGLIARKAGMTQVFAADGTMVAVSVLKVAPNVVTRLRTPERDGYAALQVGTDRGGRVTSYAVLAMADRGELFVEVGTPVYTGMIVGERNRNGDLEINITKEKKLGNMRSSTAETTVTLRPPRPFSLDQSIEFIAEDELVEVTPENIRLRKIEMDAARRLQEKRRDQKSSGVETE